MMKTYTWRAIHPDQSVFAEGSVKAIDILFAWAKASDAGELSRKMLEEIKDGRVGFVVSRVEMDERPRHHAHITLWLENPSPARDN